MGNAYALSFEQPGWLLLLLLLVPIGLISLRFTSALSRSRRILSFGVRTFVVLLLAVSLARPVWVREGDGVTVTIIGDSSASIPPMLRERAQRTVQELAARRESADDRVAVIGVGADARPIATPSIDAEIDFAAFDGDRNGTDLAAGIEQALSLAPTDTANRFVLVTDGNETSGSLVEAVELARANDIPIDVIPIRYEFENEVIVEGLVTPSRVRRGATVDARILLRSQKPTSGTLRLWRNDRPEILDRASGDFARRVDLVAGANDFAVPVPLEQGGAHRFRVEFEPDDAASDRVTENNRGESVTFASGEGRVLLVDGTGTETEQLAQALRAGGLEVEIAEPTVLSAGASLLNGFDAVVLANVARWDIDNDADAALRAYVHDLGGGLMMVGGDRAFGAGGWTDSRTAEVLPVNLDPPEVRQMVRGALALIMHSCEMAQGNFWGQQVAIAAINALSRLDYVGILSYGSPGPGIGGVGWAFPIQLAGDKAGAIAAAKSMVIGDMPDFAPSMRMALTGLDQTDAGQKHAIVISDGDPSPPSAQLIAQYALKGISITTVMVAGHGTPMDNMNMQRVAADTGGRFYNVTNPKNLPQIFMKEAIVVSRSLIVEDEIVPQVSPDLSGPLAGVRSVPNLRGYVLTVPREGLARDAIITRTEEADDPIFSWWNHGLGRSIAFTSDATTRWGTAWVSWSDYQSFWEQSMRWLMRPSSPSDVLVRTSVEGDRARVDVEALDESGFRNFLSTDARVLAPDGSVDRLELRQIGPGRYSGTFPVDTAGAYLVNVGFPVQENGETVVRSVQGAVSVPYSKEFRTLRDNASALTEIAERTGGRVIDPDVDPETVDLFDRSLLERPLAPKRVWDLLTIIAAALFVLDVATRRLAFDTRSARAAAARALSKETETGDATVSAWKKARARSRGGTESRKAVAGREQEVATAQGSTRFDGDAPGTFDASADAEVGAERAPGARPAARREREAAADGEAESSLDRLKRAKRRAGTGDDAREDDS